MKLFATALLLAGAVVYAQDDTTAETENTEAYGEEAYGEEGYDEEAEAEPKEAGYETESGTGFDPNNKCLANLSMTAKQLVDFIYKITEIGAEFESSTNEGLTALFALLAVGGTANLYGGKGMWDCLGWEAGSCMKNGGKSLNRIFTVVENIFEATVNCNTDTFSTTGCQDNVAAIMIRGNSGYWYTMEALEVCFGMGMEEEAAEEHEAEREEMEAEEFEDEAAQALFIM